jgi:WD40 repeat protein
MASPQDARVRINTMAPIKDAFLDDTGTVLGTIETNIGCQLRIWSAAGGQPRSPSISLASSSVRCRFDVTAARIAVIENNSLLLYVTASGERVIAPLIKSERIDSISFSPDGSKLAVVSGVQVDVRDAATGHLFFPPLAHRFKVSSAVFSPDSKRLAVCTTDSAVGSSCYAQIWDVTTGQPAGGKLWHRDGVQAASWRGNGQQLITVSEDGVGRIWSIPSGEVVGKEIRHRAEISHIALRSRPELALTASLDLTARLWDGEDGDPVSPAYRFPYHLKRVWFCPDSTQFVAQESGGPTWTQGIDSQESPQPVLQTLADVLAGRSPLDGQADEFQSAKALAARWEELRSIHPEWFSVSGDELLAWRRCQVERFQAAKQRRSELFHLKEILRVNPANTNALQRERRLEEILATDKTKPL